MTGISSASIAKLGKGDNVTTDILLRICVALHCNLQDIVEIVEEYKKSTNHYNTTVGVFCTINTV
ncbi:hypothetical protein ET013_04285 [Lactococcus garvieae]|nr:hypothetical protein [Lactococcus garvieae]NHJ06461.1 hypothetical protein [Lactococcus garvieae]